MKVKPGADGRYLFAAIKIGRDTRKKIRFLAGRSASFSRPARRSVRR
jgi:hypothetical protein